MSNLDVELLRRLFDYDPETGSLTWRERTEIDCPNEKERKRWNSRYAGREAFQVKDNGYRCGMIFRKPQKAHRVCWAHYYGKWPMNDIDHINGDRADNRISNLRDVTRSENSRNQKRRTDGYLGVYPHKPNKWRATICRGGKRRHIGIFATIDDALAARKRAEHLYGFHPNHGRPA